MINLTLILRYFVDKNLNNKYKSSKASKKFDLQDVSIEKIKSLPNLFKMNLTLSLMIKKMNFTKLNWLHQFCLFFNLIYTFLFNLQE